jgi:uncharacterized phage-associated protein
LDLEMHNGMKKISFEHITPFVITYCHIRGLPITPLKLQKLLYYLDAWHIAKFEKATLFEELPEAWVNGPVYRVVYDMFKDDFFRNQDIPDKCTDETEMSKFLEDLLQKMEISDEQRKLIYAVLDTYSVFSDEKLVFMTHSEAPWNEVRKGLSPIERTTAKLSVDTIYDFFNAKKTA